MINDNKPIWEGSAYEHTRWSKARIMPDMSVVLVDESDPNDVELCAADEHDSLGVCQNAVRVLVAERDELRATIAGYTWANHNQSVLIQELRDRIAKLEAGAGNADNDDTPHWVKMMSNKGSG